MKIRVELDVQPDEFPLATELLAVLRSITDHVTVNGSPDAFRSGSASGTASATMLPSQPSFQPAPAAASPAPAVPPPHPPSGAAAELAPEGNLREVFTEIIRAAEYADNVEQVAQQLEQLAWLPSADMPLQERYNHSAFQAFIEAWKDVALDPNLLAQNFSAVPFTVLLAPLGNEFKAAIRNIIIPAVFKVLASKRPPGAARSEFYLQAEAFAGLASVGVIPLDGAVTTISKMMKDPGQRAAAITVLGKMIELCAYAFPEKVQPNTLATLQEALKLADGSEEFQYDLSYIRDTMGWHIGDSGTGSNGTLSASTPAAVAAAAVSPLRPESHLQPFASLSGHSDMIYALAHDPVRRRVFSGGKDGQVFVWGEDGTKIQNVAVGDSMLVSFMDYHQGLGRAFFCGATAAHGTAGKPPCCIGSVTAGAEGYVLEKPLVRDIQPSALRCLHETTGFLTAELSEQQQPIVRFWDAGNGGPGSTIRAVQEFVGHAQHITALTRLPSTGTFASGSKDGCVLMWDVRQPSTVGALGDIPDPQSGQMRASNVIITTIESAGQYHLLSGGTDRMVKIWDVRMPGQPPLSTVNVNQVVVKLAVSAGGQAAIVGGMPSMFILGLHDASAPVLQQVEPQWQDGRPQQTYSDLKWNADGTVLFAGGKNKTLDMLAVVD